MSIHLIIFKFFFYIIFLSINIHEYSSFLIFIFSHFLILFYKFILIYLFNLLILLNMVYKSISIFFKISYFSLLNVLIVTRLECRIKLFWILIYLSCHKSTAWKLIIFRISLTKIIIKSMIKAIQIIDISIFIIINSRMYLMLIA